MSVNGLTDEQRRAVECVDRSLLVDAAAGSGKTTVLARRCVHLVCDAPAPQRCDIDELLVLTFTEAAATEMRERIVQDLRSRLDESPDDARLRQQVAWADLAQISTIHAFCLRLLRRHFIEAGIDPAAGVLDEHEAMILRRDALERVFDRLYTAARASGDDATASTVSAVNAARSAGAAFVKLVEDHGLGDDRDIAGFVLKLSSFLTSLPFPDDWLEQAAARVGACRDDVILELAAALRVELVRQADAVEAGVAGMDASGAAGNVAAALASHASQLREWSARIGGILDGARANLASNPAARSTVANAVELFETVRREMADYVLKKPAGSRRNKKDSSPEALALNAAIDAFDDVAKNLFEPRVRRRWARFSVAELRAGLAATAPYVRTLVELTRAFEAEYQDAKRRLAVLDFADLERFAFQLLSERDAGKGAVQPSAVARDVRRQFAHVLVDEFQDVNPIQEAIIRLVSREDDADARANLFVVGDVKQSIYRFRLAEPDLFVERARRLRGEVDRGAVVLLQANFRSAAPVLDFVNLVFSSLLSPGLGAVVYDERAVLRHRRTEEPGFQPVPVELHLIDRGPRGGAVSDADDEEEPDDDEDESGRDALGADRDSDDLSATSPIEREAFFIGRRIVEMMSDPDVRVEGRRARFRDFAILLRSARQQAQRIESVLRAMSIPTFADAGGEFLKAREVREVLAALHVLDNPQQDIPLAAVLRAGFFGPKLSVDDLADIRAHRRDIPFHLAAVEAARPGSRVAAGERLAVVFERIAHFRRQARRRPLAEVLWELYEESGCLARVGAWPHGPVRRANLIRLHDHARRFATFRQQGLHRFLRFVESLEEESNQPADARAIGEGEDAVRILTIHKSKGLEFPIVFVAGLGNAPNLEDVRGRLLFARRAGIGLRVVEPERFIEYPSAAHALVCEDVLRHAREEEVRILYVAMTRARDRLILVGSPKARDFSHWWRQALRPPCFGEQWSVLTGNAPLDWLMPVLANAPSGVVDFDGSGRATTAIARVRAHPWEDVRTWRLSRIGQDQENETLRQVVARLDPLPRDEPVNTEDPTAREVARRLHWVYPHLAASAQRAVVAASGFKTAPLEVDDEPVAARGAPDAHVFDVPRELRTETSAEQVPVDPRVRGTATHLVLQHLDIEAARRAGPENQIAALVAGGALDAEQAALVDVEALRWFLATDVASPLCDPTVRVFREFPYIASERVNWLDPSSGPLPPDDRVLVRGIVDVVLVGPTHLDILDYKTDGLAWDDVPRRADGYKPQVALYARAMARLWKRPVRACRLIFLAPRRIVTFDAGELSTFVAAPPAPSPLGAS